MVRFIAPKLNRIGKPVLFPYKAYELGIHSEVQLYGPSAAIDTPAEVVIQRQKLANVTN